MRSPESSRGLRLCQKRSPIQYAPVLPHTFFPVALGWLAKQAKAERSRVRLSGAHPSNHFRFIVGGGGGFGICAVFDQKQDAPTTNPRSRRDLRRKVRKAGRFIVIKPSFSPRLLLVGAQRSVTYGFAVQVYYV